MKKIPTESKYTFIMSDLDKKVVRKYKKRTKSPFLYNVPLKKISEILETSNIKYPKYVKSWFNYTEVEYIEGKKMKKDVDNSILINLVCTFVFELARINPLPIMKYTSWANNTGFFHANVKNFADVLSKSPFAYKMEQLGVSEQVVLSYLNYSLDNTRKMMMIHGDICRDNILVTNSGYALFDWETATYGDIAYELGRHFVIEKYSMEDIKKVLDRVCASMGINMQMLVKDLNIYMSFEYYRMFFIYMSKAFTLYKNGKVYEEALENAYYNYSKFNKNKTLDDLRKFILDF